jgi:hypothetical protein
VLRRAAAASQGAVVVEDVADALREVGQHRRAEVAPPSLHELRSTFPRTLVFLQLC